MRQNTMSGLFEAPPDSHEEGGDGVKENIDPLYQDLQVRLREWPET